MGDDEQDLTTSEGVDEGSRESTAESGPDTDPPTGGTAGGPVDENATAAPVPLAADEPPPGPGQQLSEGEG